MERDDEFVLLPDCYAGFLIPIFLEIGPSVSTGMGPAPFDFRHLQAWESCQGIELGPWQSSILVQMSREYVAFSIKAEEPECLAPAAPETQVVERRDAVFKALKSRLRGLIFKPKRGKIRKRKKGA
jgi:hypothetical protein